MLLTRGREGAVVFVPPVAALDATAARLQTRGVNVLIADPPTTANVNQPSLISH